jgi:hypothetical protein
MEKSQCDYCLYLAYDEEIEEDYCSLNLDQDDVEKGKYRQHASCPYFRMGDDYTIVRKQV